MPKVEVIENTGCRKILQVEVERERLDSELQITLDSVKRSVHIPGFRKGKAPESIVLKHYATSIRRDAVMDLIPKVLKEVFQLEKIHPVGEPDLSNMTINENNSISFTVTVEELPEIQNDIFKELKVTKIVYDVTDEDVENELERLRRLQSVQKEVDREAHKGDILVVNLQKLDISGVPIIGEKIERHIFVLDGLGTPSPDFDEQIIGMKKGERKVVRFTYDSTIDNPSLVGVTESYEVEVVQIVENIVPDLNDSFAVSLGNYTDINDLREKTRERLTRKSHVDAENQLHNKLIEEYIKLAPFDVPLAMVEKVIQSEIEQAKKAYKDSTFNEEEFRKKIHPDAVKAIQKFIIIDALKKSHELDAATEEIDARINELAQFSSMTPGEIKRGLIKEGHLDDIKNDIIQKKAFDWIVSVAKVKNETGKKNLEPSRIIQP